MSNQSGHTALPVVLPLSIKVEVLDDETNWLTIVDAEGDPIFSDGYEDAFPQIVRAVNLFDELVKTMQDMLFLVNADNNNYDKWSATNKCHDVLSRVKQQEEIDAS